MKSDIMNCKYTREQFIDALVAEWEHLCHDCPEEDDATPEERREELMKLNLEELIKETDTDDTYYPLDTYMEHFL